MVIAAKTSQQEACVLAVVALSNTDVPGMFFLGFSLGCGCLLPNRVSVFKNTKENIHRGRGCGGVHQGHHMCPLTVCEQSDTSCRWLRMYVSKCLFVVGIQKPEVTQSEFVHFVESRFIGYCSVLTKHKHLFSFFG